MLFWKRKYTDIIANICNRRRCYGTAINGAVMLVNAVVSAESRIDGDGEFVRNHLCAAAVVAVFVCYKQRPDTAYVKPGGLHSL